MKTVMKTSVHSNKISPIDMWTFTEKHWDDVFRYWIYRRSYTPYESDKKFMDESFYEDAHCTLAYIRDLICLPDSDILIGFLDVDSAEENNRKNIRYCKLSEIRLELYDGDQEGRLG